MGPYQVLPLRVKVDKEIIAMKVYSTFPNVPGLGLRHKMQFSIILRTFVSMES